MGRFSLEKPKSQGEQTEGLNLDGRLASLLEAIEAERTPERLLHLATELQTELALRKQRRNPN